MAKMYCGSRPEKQLLSGLLVDVVNVSRAKLLGFVVSLGRVGGLKLDSRGERRLRHALLLFGARLNGARDLMATHFDQRKHALHYQPLRDHRFKFVVDDVGRVNLFAHIARNDVVRKIENAMRLQVHQQPRMVACNFHRALARIAHLLHLAALVCSFGVAAVG